MPSTEDESKAPKQGKGLLILGWVLFFLTFPVCIVVSQKASGDETSIADGKRLLLSESLKTQPTAELLDLEGKWGLHGIQRALKISNSFDAALKDRSYTVERCLVGLRSFRLNIAISDSLKMVVQEHEVKTKIELMLRQNSIRVGEDGEKELWFTYESFNASTLNAEVYSASTGVYDISFLLRSEGMQKVKSKIWDCSYFGAAGAKALEKSIEESSDRMTRCFINAWLTANPK